MKEDIYREVERFFGAILSDEPDDPTALEVEDEYIGNSTPTSRRFFSWFGITSARQREREQEYDSVQ